MDNARSLVGPDSKIQRTLLKAAWLGKEVVTLRAGEIAPNNE